MGYEFEICYKKGKENTATDALSRITSTNLALMEIITISTDLFKEVQQSWYTDPHVADLVANLQTNPQHSSKYTWHNN